MLKTIHEMEAEPNKAKGVKKFNIAYTERRHHIVQATKNSSTNGITTPTRRGVGRPSESWRHVAGRAVHLCAIQHLERRALSLSFLPHGRRDVHISRQRRQEERHIGNTGTLKC